MKKRSSDPRTDVKDEMRPEYDFAGGVRGKHYRAYQSGHTVNIRRGDGTTIVQHYTLEDGAVLLAPDVRQYFADSDAVNDALRTLISLIPRKRRGKKPQ